MANKTKTQKPSAARKAANKASGKKTKQKKGTAAAVVGAVIALLLVAFVSLYAFGTQLEKSNTIYPNVRIAGIDVGGLTIMAAEGEVEQSIADAYASQSLEVKLPDKTLSFDPKQSMVAIDAEAAVEEALAYGRSDGPFKAVLSYLTSSSKGHDVRLETALELDTEYIEAMIAQAAYDAKRDPVNGDVDFLEEESIITVIKGTPGQFLDSEALYEVVHGAFQSGQFEPLEWDYETVPCVDADLDAVYESLAVEVQDAYYDEETHEILEGTCGYDFDLEAVKKKVDEAQYGQSVTFRLEKIEPELDVETLKAQMFGTKLESRSSYYVNNPKRTENLRLACEAINGTIINPGEVFSFNKIVGERTAEKGYQPATIYGGDGESVDGVGGGICQVASTIYYAALYMDLETVMRAPHMYTVDYVPRGMDATIYWDSGLDYQFKNNRENPIKIQANIDGGSVNITFWGVKENDNYVVMDYKVLETWNDEDKEEVDETKEPGYRELKQTAYTGAKVEAYQKVYDGSGKLLREKTIKSTYDSRPRIYIVGPEEEVPEEPEIPLDPEDPGFDPEFPELDPEFPEFDPEVPDEEWEDPWGEGEFEIVWP